MSTPFSTSSPDLEIQGRLNENASDAIKHTIVNLSSISNKRLKPNFNALKARLPPTVGKNYVKIMEVLP